MFHLKNDLEHLYSEPLHNNFFYQTQKPKVKRNFRNNLHQTQRNFFTQSQNKENNMLDILR